MNKNLEIIIINPTLNILKKLTSYIYISKWNMQYLSNGLNKFKVNDSIHVKMSIVQEITKPLKYNYKH